MSKDVGILFGIAIFGIIGALIGYGSEGTAQAACMGGGIGMIIALFAVSQQK